MSSESDPKCEFCQDSQWLDKSLDPKAGTDSRRYDVFLSYASKENFALVQFVEDYLQRLPRKLHRGRDALEIFLDNSDIRQGKAPATGDSVWDVLFRGLSNSAHLLVCVPGSHWVEHEAAWFLKHRGLRDRSHKRKVMVVLTGKSLDEAVSEPLRQIGLGNPKDFHFDLRDFADYRDWYNPVRYRNPRYKLASQKTEVWMARVAAWLLELDPETVKEALDRRRRLIQRLICLVLFVFVALVATVYANTRRIGAIRLIRDSIAALASDPLTAADRANEAMKRWPSADTEQALRAALMAPISHDVVAADHGAPLNQDCFPQVLHAPQGNRLFLCRNKTLVSYDSRTWLPLKELPLLPEGAPRQSSKRLIATDSRGEMVVVASPKQLWIWRWQGNDWQQTPFEMPSSGGFQKIAVSPDGSVVAAVSGGCKPPAKRCVHAWSIDPFTAREWSPHSLAEGDGANHLAFSESGAQLLVASEPNKRVRVIDMGTGRVQSIVRHGGESIISWVLGNPHDEGQVNSLLVSAAGATINIWRGTEYPKFRLTIENQLRLADGEEVHSLFLSPDHRRILAAAGDEAREWRVDLPAAPRQVFRHCTRTTKEGCLAFATWLDGDEVATVGRDGTIKTWAGCRAHEAEVLQHGSAVTALSLVGDEREPILATGSQDSWVRLRVREQPRRVDHTDVVQNIALSPRGDVVVSGKDPQWKLSKIAEPTPTPLDACPSSSQSRDTQIAFSRSGKFVAAPCRGEVCIYQRSADNPDAKESPVNLVGGLTIHHGLLALGISETPSNYVLAVDKIGVRRFEWESSHPFAPSQFDVSLQPEAAAVDCGASVALVVGKGGAQIVDAQSLTPQGLRNGTAASVAAVSCDGRYGLVGDAEGFGVWNLARRESIGPRRNHEKLVTAVFSDDGSLIASGAEDGTVRVWSTTDFGISRAELAEDPFAWLAWWVDRVNTWWFGLDVEPVNPKHSARVNAVDFSDDGRLLASGGEDRRTILYPVQAFAPIRDLQEQWYPRRQQVATEGVSVECEGR